MPGRVVDLGRARVHLPDRIIVDTNLVIEWLLNAFRPVHLDAAQRTAQFFTLLQSDNRIGLLPSVVCQEFFHVAIRELYRRALPNYQPALSAVRSIQRRIDWNGLYKLRPDLIEQFRPAIERFLPVFTVNNLFVIQPDELAPLPPGRRYEEELIRLVGRYQLDTADAALLLEAQRAGITSIATLDADLRRAQVDFDIYTWL